MPKEKDVITFTQEGVDITQTIISKKIMPDMDDEDFVGDTLFEDVGDITPTADLQEYIVIQPPDILPFGDPVFKRLASDFLEAFRKFTIHYSFWGEKKFDMTALGLKNSVRDTLYDMQWVLKQMSELTPKKVIRKSDGAIELVPDNFYIKLYDAILPIDGRGLFSGEKIERERVVFMLEQQRFLFQNMLSFDHKD